MTLIGAGAAGLLIWIATQLNNGHEAGYWGIIGLMAAAGLIMALSQLLGGWTKYGWPRLSPLVFLIAFIPVAVAALWVILAGEPNAGWFHNHVMAWTRDIHISGLVTDMLKYIPVLAFGAGLVFGFSFDTTGPVVRDRDAVADRRRGAVDRDDDVAYRDRGAVADDRDRDYAGRDREYAGRGYGRRDRDVGDERVADEPVSAERRNVDDGNAADTTDERYAADDGRYAADDDRYATRRTTDRT